MLVIMHHGNVKSLLQPFFNIETLWCLDIFKIDTAKRRRNLLNGLAKLLRVFLIHLNIEDINATINLEKKPLTFHDRLPTHCTDVAQSQYGRAVADNGHKIAFVRILIGIIGIGLYLKTWKCYAW